MDPDELQETADGIADGDVIADMVIYLGQLEVSPEPHNHPVSEDDGLGHYYTCRHLTEDGDCGIYETRPGMCRDYPYRNTVCGYLNCTMPNRGGVHVELLTPTQRQVD
jgi:Fe-S-cluster containining protein